MAPFWLILEQHYADVILSGHEHLYERFAPQTSTGTASVSGIRQFTVGMGGRSHYSFGTPLANSEARNATDYGVLELKLQQGRYAWAFHSASGSYTDSGSELCVVPPMPPGASCGLGPELALLVPMLRRLRSQPARPT